MVIPDITKVGVKAGVTPYMPSVSKLNAKEQFSPKCSTPLNMSKLQKKRGLSDINLKD
jgi:hypothetical protein